MYRLPLAEVVVHAFRLDGYVELSIDLVQGVCVNSYAVSNPFDCGTRLFGEVGIADIHGLRSRLLRRG